MDELLWISHATGQMEREIGRSKVHLECSVYSILVREMRYVVSVPPKKIHLADGFLKHHQAAGSSCITEKHQTLTGRVWR